MQYQARLFVSLVLLHSQAWAINKCTAPDGKVSFQDSACLGKTEVLDVQPASGRVFPEKNSAPNSKPTTEAQRIEGQIKQSQAERRTRDLQELWIPKAQAALLNNRLTCEQRKRNWILKRIVMCKT